MATPLNRSVIKAFELIEVIASRQSPPALREVAAASSMSVATAHRLLTTLRAVGAVTGGQQGGFHLGPSIRRRFPAERGDLQRDMNDLAGQIRETVHLAVWSDDDMILFLGKASAGTGAVRLRTTAGMRSEAYCTAAGKLLLAHLPPRELGRYLRQDHFVPLTDATLTDADTLSRHLAGVRRAGYAVDRGEYAPGIACLAVPVIDDRGRPVAALSASLPDPRMTPNSHERLAPILRAAAPRLLRHIAPQVAA